MTTDVLAVVLSTIALLISAASSWLQIMINRKPHDDEDAED
jgi:hypothetical protein